MLAVVALLWFVFVYKARRTGEGDGAPRDEQPEKREETVEE